MRISDFSLAAGFSWLSLLALPFLTTSLTIEISIEDDLLSNSTDGRVLVLFAPAGADPLEDTDVVTTPDLFFGYNAYNVTGGDTISFTGGSGDQPLNEVYGYPNVSLNDVEAGNYTIQAFMNVYETANRSDGSAISLRFPCGDGAAAVDGPGSLTTEAANFTITGDNQTVSLTFNNVSAAIDFTGNETGSCYQGNYEDTDLLKYIKIRSDNLSDFWNRDMYVGANVLLPAGYDANDTETLYPVIYHQGHWPGGAGAYGYDPTSDDEDDLAFIAAWDNGTIPNTTDPIPRIILVTFRHETPFYDDSYAVNTANLGPYGDALNDELIPYLESQFNMIPQTYARIQDGGSTGGWESAANLIYRPDLFGAAFSSYPDSMSFTKHQDIELYNATNAYTTSNGTDVYSIRSNINGTLTNEITVAQENHWELTYGTNSRSYGQWDIWNAVFGAQGYNNYPLEPWDKVTGEIYPEAVEYWRDFDMAQHIITNWDNDSLNLGEVLQNRLFIYVGSWDNYFLNEGVAEFERIVNGKGGEGWCNVTVLPEQPHGGNYQRLDTWSYLQLVESWINDHAPNGTTPLNDTQTSSSARGNLWEDVIEKGGRSAAVARQADPVLVEWTTPNGTAAVNASFGRWDPGMVLEAQFLVDGEASGGTFEVFQSVVNVTYSAVEGNGTLSLQVTGSKRGYENETRVSNEIGGQ